ncbi:hypothetical protein ACHQM5_012604 [Ranunculus cassubicifolius]
MSLSMAIAPEFFSDIGKKSREILFNGYESTFGIISFTCSKLRGENGIIASGKITSNSYFVGTNARFKMKNITTDVNVDKSAGLFATVAVDKIVPGLKTIFNFNPTPQKFGEMKLIYQHEHDEDTAFSTSLEFPSNPTVNFSGLVSRNLYEIIPFKNSSLSVGTDISFNTATKEFTKYDIGLELASRYFRLSVLLNDKIHTRTTSLCNYLDPKTAFSYQISGNLYHYADMHATIGFQRTLGPYTILKGQTWVDFYGGLAVKASLTHEFLPMCSFTIAGDVSDQRPPNVGFSLSLMH